jgi:NAD(P)-dependent dehydrogenase (short-subunit alcohol dehydrogenase family)
MTQDQDETFSLTGEIALVTGATRGIGYACAKALGRAGASVALGCRDIAAGNALAEDLRKGGMVAVAVQMDMMSLDSIVGAVARAEQDLGPLSILVNNAGQSRPAAAMDVNEAEYDAMFDLNVKGAFFASQATARLMAKRGRGAIINIASQAGLVALDGEPVYCMTKAAMIHMTHAWRLNGRSTTFA